MAMDGSDQWISSPTSSFSHDQYGVVWSPPPKRPAGRTKFKETRHPVYRGVRHRGSAGRWVCEVRVPGMRNKRLWLGTHLTAESAGRAHDAAMLALRGPSAGAASCLLNFQDSAWLLTVTPSAFADFDDVQRASLAAVADFQRREAANVAATVPVPVAVDEITSIASMVPADNAGSWPVFQPCVTGMFEVPAAMGCDMFELDMPGEMDLGMYYADLAEGLLMEQPPPPAPDTGACWESEDYGDGGADTALWSY